VLFDQPDPRIPSRTELADEALDRDARTPELLLVTMPAVDMAENVGLLENVWTPVKVCKASVRAIVELVPGSVTVVVAEAESVVENAPEVASVELLASVSVPLVVVVIVAPFIVPGRTNAEGMESVGVVVPVTVI
jgi:hypothetical protein